MAKLEPSEYLTLHNHKENMAWAATALYIPAVLALAEFGGNVIQRSSGLLVPLLLLMALLAALANSFVAVQMYLRWDAHWRTGSSAETKGNNALLTELITYTALILATQVAATWMFLKLAPSQRFPTAGLVPLPTFAATLAILVAFRRSKGRPNGKSYEDNRLRLLALILVLADTTFMVLAYSLVNSPVQVVK